MRLDKAVEHVVVVPDVEGVENDRKFRDEKSEQLKRNNFFFFIIICAVEYFY